MDHPLQVWRSGQVDGGLTLNQITAADTFTEGWDKPNEYMGLYFKNSSGSTKNPALTIREDMPKEHSQGFASGDNYAKAIVSGAVAVYTPNWFMYVHEEKFLVLAVGGPSTVVANVIFPVPARMFGTPAFGPYMKQT